MGAWSHDRDLAAYEIAHVENALIDGNPPVPIRAGNNRQFTAGRVAADHMGIERQSLYGRIGAPDMPGRFFRHYGLTVEWSLYRKPSVPPELEKPEPKEQPPPEPAGDPIDIRRLRDRVDQLTKLLKEAERRAGDAEGIRASVLGLMQEPLVARLVMPRPDDPPTSGGRTVILHLSDIHYGEVVSGDEMDNLNRYDATIAQKRLGRFFATAAGLMTKHWKGPPPEEIIVCLGGDLISGNLHAELEITNLPAVPATVREVGEHIAGGIIMLANEIKRPIRVFSVPGNHGRLTDKPRSKGRSASSLDLLATDFCEAVVKGARLKAVTFHKAQSPDLYFSTYGFHWILTHGDALGFRGGGVGFIGPMATIIKGHRKLVDTSWRSGKPVHYCLTAHFHTTGKTSFGWANGSVIGYGEYARDLRADPEVARQNMLIVHPRHGVIADMPLYLGAPDEGSLYAGPASVIRPQWDD